MFFWENLSSPQSVPHYTNVGQGRSGVRFPLVHCRSVSLSVEFEHVSPEFGARAEFATVLAL